MFVILLIYLSQTAKKKNPIVVEVLFKRDKLLLEKVHNIMASTLF